MKNNTIMKNIISANFRMKLLLFATVVSFSSFSQTITTVCGTGTAGFSGDNGAATAARVDALYGQIACDKYGNVYIADCGNHRVRKIDVSTGTITTIAGTGVGGFSGDGGLGTFAQLNNPDGIAVDNAGNIYIADYNNNRIRRIDPTGTITTICGNGTPSSTGDGGLATAATVSGPGHLCIDPSGNIFITDYASRKIRKIATTGTITTYCGTGANSNTGDGGLATAATISDPWAIASDLSGNIYVASYYGSYVRRIGTTGTITAFAGISGSPGFSGDGGAALSGQLNSVTGLVVNNSGDVFIADSANHRIRKVTSTGTITTIVGTGTFGFSGDGGLSTSAQIYGPNGGMGSFGCLLYVIDNGNARIGRVQEGVTPSLTVASSAATVLCLGQSATLTASGANTYSWNTGPTTSTVLISPTITTSYSVIATGTNGCQNTAVFSQSVSSCANVNEFRSNNGSIEFVIYPNPSTGELSLEVQNASHVVISDIMGREVKSVEVIGGKASINLSENANGVYILSFVNEGRIIGTQKIVKN